MLLPYKTTNGETTVFVRSVYCLDQIMLTRLAEKVTQLQTE
jgi:hypothetical protein